MSQSALKTTQTTKTLNVDPRHSGIRTAALVGFIGGFILAAFYITPAVATMLGYDIRGNLIPGLLSGAALGFGLSWSAENLLIYVWPSGRKIALTPDAITLADKDEGNAAIDIKQGINAFAWSFPITSRRTWVPRGWHCVALRIMQGKTFITPYTFMSPKKLEDVPHARYFTELISRKEAEKPGNQHLLDMFQEQTHLRAAEDDRWREGAELVPDDFLALLTHLEAHADDWPHTLDRRTL